MAACAARPALRPCGREKRVPLSAETTAPQPVQAAEPVLLRKLAARNLCRGLNLVTKSITVTASHAAYMLLQGVDAIVSFSTAVHNYKAHQQLLWPAEADSGQATVDLAACADGATVRASVSAFLWAALPLCPLAC